jgi:hypothetical protein
LVPFPEGVDVVALPGFPDRDIEVEGGGSVYPTTSVDVLKRLRRLGVGADFAEPREHRREVTLKAQELWIPVLQVTQQVLINLAVWQFVEAITLWRSRPPERPSAAPDQERQGESASDVDEEDDRIVHVRMAVVLDTGEARWIEADGSPANVAEVLTRLKDELRE